MVDVDDEDLASAQSEQERNDIIAEYVEPEVREIIQWGWEAADEG